MRIISTVGRSHRGFRANGRRIRWTNQRLVTLAALVAIFTIWVTPGAVAMAPERLTFSRSSTGVVDCGAFQDNYTDVFSGTETTFFGTDGNAIRIVVQMEHHSNDVNSVTGLTLHEHGHATFVFDLVNGGGSVSGNLEIATRPGTGVVIQDVGRLEFDADGNMIFFAGGTKHSQTIEGEQIFCTALAP
jgi:hypothetical protein